MDSYNFIYQDKNDRWTHEDFYCDKSDKAN